MDLALVPVPSPVPVLTLAVFLSYFLSIFYSRGSFIDGIHSRRPRVFPTRARARTCADEIASRE